LLIVDPITRRFWANRPTGDATPLAGHTDVWTGVLPTGIGLANTAIEWANVRWAMILTPLPDDRTARRVLLAHESWHRIQTAIGLPAQGADNGHLTTVDGRVLLRLELRALARTMASTSCADRESVAREALAFRAERHTRFPRAAEQERTLDRNEGLAEYSGVRIGAGDGARAYAVALLARYADLPNYARSFAYATGPAYGLILDCRPGNWRRALGVSSAPDLLVDRLGAATDLPALRARYGDAELRSQEEARAAATAAEVADITARFTTGSRLILPLRQMQMEFDPSVVRPIDGLGSYYAMLTLRDVWGEFSATKGAVIAADFSHAVAADPLRDSGGLSGPGWTLKLAAGWRVSPPDASGAMRVERAP
jgi:hypothetical protein